MRQGWKWWVAGLVTVLVFAVVTWIFADFVAPLWVKQDDGVRWAVGLGAGTAASGLAAVWGKSYASAPAQPHGPEPTGASGTDDPGRAPGGPQVVEGSAAGEGITQVSGAGSVKITRRGGSPAPLPPRSEPREAPSAAEPPADGQYMVRSDAAGPVDQVRGVTGDVEIEQ
ncbi:hypothetical protein [Streptomyces sp. NPDC088762]|uniref:hypothetical protein n=1 Tax=Streptomyces sp. NPDC088762 TaxID=3365891 RepID=UPI00380A1378